MQRFKLSISVAKLSALIFTGCWRKDEFLSAQDGPLTCYKQLETTHKLPCKYPRFTRFMTSLAVRLETSSKSQKGGGERKRKGEAEESREKEEEEEKQK